MTRGRILGAVVAVAAATAAIAGWQYLADRSGMEPAAAAETADAEPTPETVEVARGDLATDYDFTGQVSFGESWRLPLSAEEVVTAGWPEGTIVDFDDVLVEIAGKPVFLAEGDVPMYRELALTGSHMKGEDVAQLQRFLLAAGFDDEGRLEVDGVFGPSTRRAVEDWQETVGLDDTGRVDPSQIVFSPTRLRISSTARVGTTFEALEVTEATSTVTVDIDNSERARLPLDGQVTVELADGTTLDGTVVNHERVVGDDGSTSWQAVIDVAGEIDGEETSVLVYSTVVDASDVLIVPTSALLAVAEGGFAVEVVEDGQTRLVPVEVGKVVNAQAEISGAVEPDDLVVMPS